MSSLVFLIAIVVLSLIGGFVLWFRERSPSSMESHMRAFEEERKALSPESWTDVAQPRRRRPNAQPRSRDPRAG
ncbi:MAG: hypothetical protein ACRD12_24835 [Acidimicrobiales bacterium]